ncbi:PilX N-terminal domain-containing pilus assembly protein [Roseateles sp.]|jgi:hypothetical protein|uniref:pilus assembly PilX family protein n=1 Tax=Roseateles sp. TaxID=1971397 RepID=UPI0037C680A9
MSARATHRQRGAATLVVVMVLFLIMAMMAAYANRNLIFEQRIASNYYRSGIALETAEAGIDWALGKLNSGNMDALCVADGAGASSFRDRYLSIGADHTITPRLNRLTPIAACIDTAAQGLVCQCRNDGTVSSPAVAAAAQFQPMFGVALRSVNRPGVVRLQVTACTSTLSECSPAQEANAAAAGLARSVVTVDIALLSALKVPPASPLTVRDSVDLGAPGLGLHNAETSTQGLLLQSGGAYTGQTGRSTTLPGSPVRAALISSDPSLATANPMEMFAKFFGMAPGTYREQPAVRRLTCPDDCSAALQSAYAEGARMLWIDGRMNLRSNIVLGSAADPVLIISDAEAVIEGPMLINGLLYARGNVAWSNASGQPATLTGALLSEGQFVASGLVDLVYQRGVIDTLRNRRGSFVRVPSSWTDTQ